MLVWIGNSLIEISTIFGKNKKVNKCALDLVMSSFIVQHGTLYHVECWKCWKCSPMTLLLLVNMVYPANQRACNDVLQAGKISCCDLDLHTIKLQPVKKCRWRLLGYILRRDQQIPANQAITYYFKQTNNTGFRGKPRTTLPTKLDEDLVK